MGKSDKNQPRKPTKMQSERSSALATGIGTAETPLESWSVRGVSHPKDGAPAPQQSGNGQRPTMFATDQKDITNATPRKSISPTNKPNTELQNAIDREILYDFRHKRKTRKTVFRTGNASCAIREAGEDIYGANTSSSANGPPMWPYRAHRKLTVHRTRARLQKAPSTRTPGQNPTCIQRRANEIFRKPSRRK